MKVLSVAVDFDHTLVDGHRMIPGAKDAMQQLRDMGYRIIVHSCNGDEWIRQTLNTLEIHYDEVWDGKGKPLAHAYIDDRGIGFRGNWQECIAEFMDLDARRRKLMELTSVDATAEAGKE